MIRLLPFYLVLVTLPHLALDASMSKIPSPNASTLFGQEEQPEDKAFSVLLALRQDVLFEAFSNLEQARYTMFLRTEQYDTSNSLEAHSERVVQYGSRDGLSESTIIHDETTGVFNESPLHALLTSNSPMLDPSDFPTYILPDDPAYLSPRNRADYSFRMLEDTLLWNHRLSRIEIVALPSTQLPIRKAKLLFDPSTQDIVGYSLERKERRLLFHESSQLSLQLRPFKNQWIPHLSRSVALVRTPLQDPVVVRSSVAFFDVELPN